MVHLDLLDTSDLAQIECVRYCFLPVITRDLNRVLQHWNEHRIRRSRNTECPSGKPDVLYFQPEIYQTRDFKMPLPDNLDVVEQEHSSYPPASGVSMEFEIIGRNITEQNGLHYPPNTVEEATELFVQITQFIKSV